MAPQRRSLRPIDPGAMLAATHELEDGGRVRLRLTRPSDAAPVRDFLERLSPETRHRRFLAPMPTIPEATIRHFTFYDPRERLVVAAVVAAHGGEEIEGLADVALLSTGLAELGLVVEDSQQRRGIGRLLSHAIASLAIQRGATHVKAQMLEPGAAMLGLLRALGPTVEAVEEGNLVAYTRLPAVRRRAA
jgi:GNAT superfamily N-acetyltransferase